MSLIATTTTAINTDEPCMGLAEMNLVRPQFPEMHRFMIVTVVRLEKPVDFWVDLGPAKNFDRPQFRIITGGTDPITGKLWSEHRVGEAVDTANHLREGPFEQPEPPPAHNLAQAYYDQPDIRKKRRKSVSTFGHGGILQRS